MGKIIRQKLIKNKDKFYEELRCLRIFYNDLSNHSNNLVEKSLPPINKSEKIKGPIFGKHGDFERPKFTKQYSLMLNNMTIVYLVALLDAYLYDSIFNILTITELGREVVKEKNGKKNISYNKVFKYNNLEEIHIEQAEKLLNNLEQSSINKRWDLLSDDFNFDLDKNISIGKENLNEVYQTRNLIVHNKSLVDEKYLKIVSDPQFRLGDERKVDSSYVNDSFDYAKKFVEELIELFRPKFFNN